MRQHHLLLKIYYLLIVLLTLLPRQIHSLRCKCNTNRGPTPCMGDFCDIHSRDGKRAACGALRRARQTIFACVLIRRTSNDTYCHVVGSTTACWCRQMDFCNADLEAELFDVEETAEESEAYSEEQSGREQEQYIIEATLQQVPVEPHTRIPPVMQPLIATPTITTLATTVGSATEGPKISTSTKRSIKTKINPAIRMDVVEKMKLTPQQKEQPPTIAAETIFENYDDELDEDDDGFQWQAIAIPDSAMSTRNMATTGESKSTNSQKAENNKSITVEVLITHISATTPATTVITPAASAVAPNVVPNTTVTFASKTRPDFTVKPIFDHFPDPTPAFSPDDDKTQTTKVVDRKFRPESIWNLPLKPVDSPVPSTMISSTAATTTSRAAEGISEQPLPATIQEILQHQQQIPKAQPNYARLKLNGTSPTFVYSHSAPKTILDQWKREEQHQQQQPGDLDWAATVDSHDNSGGTSSSGNSSSSSSSSNSRLTSAFFTSSSTNSLLLVLLFATTINHFCIFPLI